MSENNKVEFILDSETIETEPGRLIMEVAEEAGHYIPRLCHLPGAPPAGACRICTVMVNGRPQAACTTPVAEGMVVENDTEELRNYRRDLIQMLFSEGNHYCMFCEKSGLCELQALAYRHGITSVKYPFLFPDREVDASHPDLMIDHNRCILCGRCVRVSQLKDGKNVFQFIHRGIDRKIGVNAEVDLFDTDVQVTDKAADACPVGALLKKRVGFQIPVGQRKYDHEPIGSEIETSMATNSK